MLLPEASQKLFQVPAMDSDRVWRQAPFPDHIVCIFLDQVCVRAARDFSRAQAAQEPEPLLGVRDETHPPIPVISHVMAVGLGLTVDPQIGGRMDLLDSDRIGCLQVQVVDQARLQILPDGRDAATDPYVQSSRRVPCSLQGCVDAIGDKVENGAALHLDFRDRRFD